MRTFPPILSRLFFVALVALCLPRHTSAQKDPPIPPGEAMDSTKAQSNICEVHHVGMFKRAVPFAHGMIPMSRAEAERGEWKRRMDHYPHPGDVQPATDIVLPGETGRCVVYVCAKCAAAKKSMEKARASRTTDAVWPPDPNACEAIVEKYEASAMRDHLEGGGFLVYDAVVFKIVSPAPKAGQEIRVYLKVGTVADDSALRKAGARYRFVFDFALLKEAEQLFSGAFKTLQRVEPNGEVIAERLLRAIDPEVRAKIESELAQWEKAAKDKASADGLPPSRQTAYYLLSGLATQGCVMEGLSEPERRIFDVEQGGGVQAKLISVFADVRVALLDHEIQDKAGTYVLRTAVLYVQRDGKWIESGKGSVTAPDF